MADNREEPSKQQAAACLENSFEQQVAACCVGNSGLYNLGILLDNHSEQEQKRHIFIAAIKYFTQLVKRYYDLNHFLALFNEPDQRQPIFDKSMASFDRLVQDTFELEQLLKLFQEHEVNILSTYLIRAINRGADGTNAGKFFTRTHKLFNEFPEKKVQIFLATLVVICEFSPQQIAELLIPLVSSNADTDEPNDQKNALFPEFSTVMQHFINIVNDIRASYPHRNLHAAPFTTIVGILTAIELDDAQPVCALIEAITQPAQTEPSPKELEILALFVNRLKTDWSPGKLYTNDEIQTLLDQAQSDKDRIGRGEEATLSVDQALEVLRSVVNEHKVPSLQSQCVQFFAEHPDHQQAQKADNFITHHIYSRKSSASQKYTPNI